MNDDEVAIANGGENLEQGAAQVLAHPRRVPAGAKLHTGRSRNDQVALDMRLWLHDEIDALLAEVCDLQRALVGLGGKNADIQSLQETLLYGVKGLAAYAHHARRLGAVDEGVNAFVEEALFATVTNVNFDIPSLLELVLETDDLAHKLLGMQLMIETLALTIFQAVSPSFGK